MSTTTPHQQYCSSEGSAMGVSGFSERTYEGINDTCQPVSGKVEIRAGAVFKIPYPFIWDKYHDGLEEIDTLRPGVRSEGRRPDDFVSVADEMGKQILTVVSVHKPGKYPPRVFYTRHWEGPAGNVFGRMNLRIRGIAAFRRDLKGYRHYFELTTQEAHHGQ